MTTSQPTPTPTLCTHFGPRGERTRHRSARYNPTGGDGVAPKRRSPRLRHARRCATPTQLTDVTLADIARASSAVSARNLTPSARQTSSAVPPYSAQRTAPRRSCSGGGAEFEGFPGSTSSYLPSATAHPLSTGGIFAPILQLVSTARRVTLDAVNLQLQDADALAQLGPTRTKSRATDRLAYTRPVHRLVGGS
ncbi:hypothetical protein MSAN_02376300 [Mycena sanguinolenta]|uniref:Uncharacterized protein n=1 Tax=Mycena sanguinolenta TaxID=230812 RepID=A0A8H6X4L3_9AGAR|nr:hypothetical protein MSAN_02376300 [Mycena sanguinolenta]